MQPVPVGQALHGGDLASVGGDGQLQAGHGAAAVDQDRAGAALSLVAALLGAVRSRRSRRASSRVVRWSTDSGCFSPLMFRVTLLDVGGAMGAFYSGIGKADESMTWGGP
ncbi:hypothetical protein GCM10023238_00570 [Streptomyces heliomycini]